MAEVRLRLSAKGIRNIAFGQDSPTFTFHVGDATYIVPSVLADFLSEKVANLHRGDSTIDSYDVQTTDPGRLFAGFVGMAQGEELRVNPSNFTFYATLARELGNHELIRSISSHFAGDITNQNVAERLQARFALGESAEEEITYTAEHFLALNDTQRDQIPLGALELILASEKFKMQSPADNDTLLDLVLRRYRVDAKALALLEFVDFEYLTPPAVSRFVAVAPEFIGELNQAVWKKIVKRLTFSELLQDKGSKGQ
jgi:hypothetical protein